MRQAEEFHVSKRETIGGAVNPGVLWLTDFLQQLNKYLPLLVEHYQQTNEIPLQNLHLRRHALIKWDFILTQGDGFHFKSCDNDS